MANELLLRVRSKRFLGMSEDYWDLMSHVGVEEYYVAMKGENGEMWPYVVEVEVCPGEVRDIFDVVRVSWFSAYIVLFDSVEDLNYYVRERDKVLDEKRRDAA